jgi:hypothetical protein
MLFKNPCSLLALSLLSVSHSLLYAHKLALLGVHYRLAT